jgi:hypothetical protein
MVCEADEKNCQKKKNFFTFSLTQSRTQKNFFPVLWKNNEYKIQKRKQNFFKNKK